MLECQKCNTIFTSQKRYDNHVSNILNPCDNRCFGCNYKGRNRRDLTRHKEKCEQYQNKEKVMSIINNTNNTNNVTTAGSHNTNNTNNNTNNIVNNQNLIMLTPYALTHMYINKEEVVKPAQNVVLGLIRKQRFKEAYEKLFQQIHGNPNFPQYHNVFIQDREKEEVCVFEGKRFTYELWDTKIPGLFEYFKYEMKWLIRTADIDVKEKDQLLWDIQANWMRLNTHNNENMERILFNNKDIVEDTIKTKYVVPDLATIGRFTKAPPEQIVNNSHRIKLP